MKLPRLRGLLDAWNRARAVFGEEIAQEATLIALSQPRGSDDELAGVLIAKATWLRMEGYHDAVEYKKLFGERHKMATACEWRIATDGRTPETIALLRERLRAVEPAVIEAAANGTYLPRAKWRQARGQPRGTWSAARRKRKDVMAVKRAARSCP